jgi:hypothetical protein
MHNLNLCVIHFVIQCHDFFDSVVDPRLYGGSYFFLQTHNRAIHFDASVFPDCGSCGVHRWKLMGDKACASSSDQECRRRGPGFLWIFHVCALFLGEDGGCIIFVGFTL